MIPILGIALTLLVSLPAIAKNQIHIIQLGQQLTELNADKPACDGKGSPDPECGRRDK